MQECCRCACFDKVSSSLCRMQNRKSLSRLSPTSLIGCARCGVEAVIGRGGSWVTQSRMMCLPFQNAVQSACIVWCLHMPTSNTWSVVNARLFIRDCSTQCLRYVLPVQLCVHQQLELRALCSVFHSLARLVVVQQQQQQRLQQEEQQQPQLHPRRQATATLPQPLLQRLLDATQQALLHTAASPWQQVAEQQCPPQGDPQLLQQQQQLSQHPLPLQGHMSNCIQQQGDQQCLQGSLQTGQAAQQQHLRRAGQQQHAAEQDQWQCSEGLSPAGLNTFADALRLLRTDPPAEWQAAYIAAAQQLMHCGDARNVPLMLAPLVRWRNPPQQSWLQQYMAACQSLMPSMQAQVRRSHVKQRVMAMSPVSFLSGPPYCQAVGVF